MKRTCSLLLAAILAGTLATPAAAAATPAADDRLTQVTQAVKETLGLGDDYTSFYGELQEDSYRALWSLTLGDRAAVHPAGDRRGGRRHLSLHKQHGRGLHTGQ